MDRIHKHHREPYLLFFAVTIIILLAAFVNITPPNTIFHIAVFIIGISCAIGLFVHYIFSKTHRSILLACGTATLLTLRYIGLTSPIYIALLLTCIIAIDIHQKEI